MKWITLLLFLFIPLFGFSQEPLKTNGLNHYIGTEKVTRKQFKQELAQNPAALRKFKSAEITGYTGIALTTISLGIVVTGLADGDGDWLNTRNNSTRNNNIQLYGALAGSILYFISTAQYSNSTKTYNSDLNSSTRIAPTSNGIGLVYRF